MSVLYILNQLSREDGEDLDDNDAIASISDVQTAGILLAQKYIRISLMALMTCLLTSILLTVVSEGHPYCKDTKLLLLLLSNFHSSCIIIVFFLLI